MIRAKPEVEGLTPYVAPLEGRRPMLRLDFNESTLGPSPRVLEAVRALPPEAYAAYPEYAGLTEAFAGWLPDKLLWRTKAEFGDGSGARDALTQAVEATVSDAEFEAERSAVDPPLRTKEELAYYRVWRGHLQGISAERTLSRFARA